MNGDRRWREDEKNKRGIMKNKTQRKRKRGREDAKTEGKGNERNDEKVGGETTGE